MAATSYNVAQESAVLVRSTSAQLQNFQILHALHAVGANMSTLTHLQQNSVQNGGNYTAIQKNKVNVSPTAVHSVHTLQS